MLSGNFSHRQLMMIGVLVQDFLLWVKKLNISHLRIGCYWDECESTKNQCDFKKIISVLDFCEENNIDVILCVGLKAPRIPEFYPPFWLKNPYDFEENKKYLLRYLQECINQFKNYKCIKIWQIENEPLDPSPPHWQKIPLDILIEEIKIFRKNNISNICVNFWGNEIFKRRYYTEILDYIDIIGLNFYFEMYNLQKQKIETILSLNECLDIINFFKDNFPHKDIIITEFQFEPWITGNIINNFLPIYEKVMRKYPRIFYHLTDFIAKGKEKYINFENIHRHYKKVAQIIPTQKIYLWGLEYIYKNKKDEIILNLFK